MGSGGRQASETKHITARNKQRLGMHALHCMPNQANRNSHSKQVNAATGGDRTTEPIDSMIERMNE